MSEKLGYVPTMADFKKAESMMDFRQSSDSCQREVEYSRQIENQVEKLMEDEANPDNREEALEMIPDLLLFQDDNGGGGVRFVEDLFLAFGFSLEELLPLLREGFNENLKREQLNNAIAILDIFDLDKDQVACQETEDLIIKGALVELELDAYNRLDREKNTKYNSVADQNSNYNYWFSSHRLLSAFDLWDKFLNSEGLEQLCQQDESVAREIDLIKKREIEFKNSREEFDVKDRELYGRLREMPEGEFERRLSKLAHKIKAVLDICLEPYDLDKIKDRFGEDEWNLAKSLEVKKKELDDQDIGLFSQKDIERNCYDFDGPSIDKMYWIRCRMKNGGNQYSAQSGHFGYDFRACHLNYIEQYLDEEEKEFLKLALLDDRVEQYKSDYSYAKAMLDRLGIESE